MSEKKYWSQKYKKDIERNVMCIACQKRWGQHYVNDACGLPSGTKFTLSDADYLKYVQKGAPMLTPDPDWEAIFNTNPTPQSQQWTQPWSKLCVDGSTVLVLHRLSHCVITDKEQQERQIGHGVFLKEKGFYPIGHRQGIIVLSYYDEQQKAIVYEKLVFKRAIPRSKVEEIASTLGEYERAFSFE